MTTKYDVAVMHDFFVDRLVHVGSIDRITKMVRAKADAGGGGIHDISQDEVRGGNAVNMAHALARLGLKTLLITHADAGSQRLLETTFQGLDAELRVKPLKAGLTVALEGADNVMMSDGGGASEFGPEELGADDWKALKGAKVVCCVNWAANSRGSALLETVRRRLGKGQTLFFDPADFRDRVPEFRKLMSLISRKHLVDWVSMNEEEGKAAAQALGLEPRTLGEVCMLVARELGVVFDLHARRTSFRSEGNRVVAVPGPKAKSKRLTGAGDVWDAGVIYARLQRWDDRRALGFANAAAILYLENEAPVPPGLGEVLAAVE